MECQEVWKPEFSSAVELFKISGVKKINFTDFFTLSARKWSTPVVVENSAECKASLAWRRAY